MATFIADPDDPRIAPYRFVRERDLARDDGLFVAEGDVVVQRLLTQGRFPVHSVLVQSHHVPRYRELVAACPSLPPLYHASTDMLSAIAGFPLHRGILALGRRGERVRLEAALHGLPATARLLAAIGIANHDNLGALLRNAAAFGVDMVALDATCCDPLYRKAIRVSVGAALSLPIAFADDGPAMLRTLAAHDVQVLALSPSADREVSSITPHARCALLVGSEGAGLAPDILAACDPVRITMAAGWDSLNVATSAAIALYELTRRT